MTKPWGRQSLMDCRLSIVGVDAPTNFSILAPYPAPVLDTPSRTLAI
jgi:hypothetical protein